MCNADGLFCLNRGLRRFSQMGYDAPRPFSPGFWVPASAGMTEGARERGRRALFFSGFPPARERRSVLGLKEQQIRRSFSVGVGFG